MVVHHLRIERVDGTLHLSLNSNRVGGSFKEF